MNLSRIILLTLQCSSRINGINMSIDTNSKKYYVKTIFSTNTVENSKLAGMPY